MAKNHNANTTGIATTSTTITREQAYSQGYDSGFNAGFIAGVRSGYAQGYDDANRAIEEAGFYLIDVPSNRAR